METNNEAPPVTTRSVGIKYGLYAALAAVALFLLPVLLNQDPFNGPWNWGEVGVTPALIIIAHKSFKDNGEGFMSYGEGFAIGFWIILISTLIVVPVMYTYLTFIDGGPLELFYENQRAEMAKGGAPEEFIDVSLGLVRKLFWIGIIGGSIVGGIVITLILAIFTQKKAPEQAF